MLKLKILHKGLLLVATPLVFGILFVLLLYCGLSESNRRFQHELLLKDAMITDDAITRSIFASRICAISYFISQDSFFEDRYSNYVKDTADSFKNLQKILKKERALQTPLRMLKDEISSSNKTYFLIMHGPQLDVGISDVFEMFSGLGGVGKFFTSSPAFYLMEKLQKLSEKEAAGVLEMMHWLQLTLLGSVAGSIAITVGLATFFCLNITNRLLMIINNTVSLSKRTPLQSPLRGSDEIAELDQFLFKSAKEIRELEKFKKEMIGVVSHELKSPLSSVALFLSSLAEGVYGKLNEKDLNRVQRTSKSTGRLMELIKELLILDRLELEMVPEQVSIKEIITTSVDVVKDLSEQSGIRIEIDSTGGTILADRNRLVQVIVNLLSNAIKYSPQEATVRIQTKLSDGKFECRICDQGPGIPEEFRKNIFEPFKQVDATDSITKKGTGLGLTISKSIVEQHGGEIGIDSILGKGSTFWFVIPDREQKQDNNNPPPLHDQIQDSSHFSRFPLTSSSSAPKAKRRKFGVLQQGLIIISVPLIFQLAFSSVISGLLFQLQEQIKREKHSKEIVSTLNSMEQKFLVASNYGITYVYLQDPSYLKAWQIEEKAAFDSFEQVKQLCAGDPQQDREIKEIGDWLHTIKALLDKMVSLNRDKELGSVSQLQVYVKENNIAEQLKPLFDKQIHQDRLMDREKTVGKRLAAQRIRMIRNVYLALLIGICLNIALSIFLAMFLMSKITSRLQHVADNTARLVRREPLNTPIPGWDEIAYLDQILFSAGNHLMQLEAFKKDLISVVSHELRTPLLSISASLQLFSTGILANLTEKGSKRLRFAREEAERLIRLINDLLDIEKMEAGKFVLDYEQVKASDLIDASIFAVAQLAELKQIKFEITAADHQLCADSDRICQVLINLLSNAIKFSPQAGTIQIIVEANNSTLEFKVSDRGRGIPDDLQARIFDRFVQVEKSDASEKGGSGLGLAISKAIIEQHGGQIGVHSRINEGSTFWFSLPRRQVPVSPPPQGKVR